MQVRLTVNTEDMAAVLAGAKCYAEMLSGKEQKQLWDATKRVYEETKRAAGRLKGGR